MWHVGDVVAASVDVTSGVVCTAVNGVWQEGAAAGTVQVDVDAGVVPCVTLSGGLRCRVNLGSTEFTTPPSGSAATSVWAWIQQQRLAIVVRESAEVYGRLQVSGGCWVEHGRMTLDSVNVSMWYPAAPYACVSGN